MYLLNSYEASPYAQWSYNFQDYFKPNQIVRNDGVRNDEKYWGSLTIMSIIDDILIWYYRFPVFAYFCGYLRQVSMKLESKRNLFIGINIYLHYSGQYWEYSYNIFGKKKVTTTKIN